MAKGAVIFGIAGWSGSGKTTLMVGLIAEFRRRGISVSTVKHAHHRFDVDTPGKDSYEHRAAGAGEVMVVSARRWALMHENREGEEPSVDELLAHMAPADLVLIEGFKSYPHEKLEVRRIALDREPLSAGDDTIVAVACDGPVAGCGVPVLDLNDIPAIADFIAARCGLAAIGKGVA